MKHLASVFIGLSLLASAIASIGLVCSAYSSSQIVAAASTVALGFLFYDLGWTNAFVAEGTARLFDSISLRLRFGHMAEGFVFAADLVYFAGVGLVSAALSRFSLALRRVFG